MGTADALAVKLAGVTLVRLAPGVSRTNFWTYMYAAFICIGLLAGLNVLQSYVLVEHLHIPRSQQGTVSGNLALWQEAITLVLITPFGVFADRVGRRPVMVFGLFALALGYGLYPFATTVGELTLFRVIAAFGAASLGGIIAVVANDYPAETSRGRLHGFGGFMNGLGVLFMTAIVAQIPAILRRAGFDAVVAGQAMFLFAAALAFGSAFVLRAGLRPGTGAARHERPPLRQLLTSGIRAARNPRILLSYACAFTGRADVAIKGTFIALWALVAAPAAGLTAAEALSRVGAMLGIMGIAGLLWTPAFGYFLDRVNRVTGVAVAMGLAGLGYSSMALITSPLDLAMAPAFVLMGIGQLSAITASVTLVGQEAPVAERGGVVSMNAWFGAVGILLSVGVGGRLFDSWGPFAPFVLAGGVQLVLCLAAVGLRVMAPGGPVPARAAAAG